MDVRVTGIVYGMNRSAMIDFIASAIGKDRQVSDGFFRLGNELYLYVGEGDIMYGKGGNVLVKVTKENVALGVLDNHLHIFTHDGNNEIIATTKIKLP